jgi:hypothetical protein
MNQVCETIGLRLDPRNRPGLLGIVCNETTFWVHRVGVTDFVKDVTAWRNYVQQHPDLKEVPTSLSFRPCVVDTEGPYVYDLVYSFSAEAVKAAFPLIMNTWKIYGTGDIESGIEKVTTTRYLIQNVATNIMASLGDIKLSANHLALGVLRYKHLIEDESVFPEGIDLRAPLREAIVLDTAFERVQSSPDALAEELERRLPHGTSYPMEENLIVLFETDAQDFYQTLERISGSQKPMAIHFLYALLHKPSPEFVSAVSDLRIEIRSLRREAERLLPRHGKARWWRFWD